MADEIDYKIIGDDMQLIETELDTNEAVRAEAGAMMYMGPGIKNGNIRRWRAYLKGLNAQ
ncbi:MAG: AIM24 family protein [Methanolobus sp.]|nr:AIM24 family protein [Methanolobus sp.]